MNFYEDLEQRAKNDDTWKTIKTYYDASMLLINRAIYREGIGDCVFEMMDKKLLIQKALIETLREGEQNAK